MAGLPADAVVPAAPVVPDAAKLGGTSNDAKVRAAMMEAFWQKNSFIDLQNDVNTKKPALSEHLSKTDTTSGRSPTHHATVSELRKENEDLTARLTSVSVNTEELKKQQAATKTTAKTQRDEVAFLRARNENLEHDLKEFHTRLALSERGYDKLKQAHTRLLNGGGMSQKAVANKNFRIKDLENIIEEKNNRIKNFQKIVLDKDNRAKQAEVEAAELRGTLSRIRSRAATLLTHMDVAYEELRIFDCKHKSLNAIPDGSVSTHRISKNDVADEFFELWDRDKAFLEQYTAARRSLVEHHAAHGHVKEGRGVAASRIKSVFVQADTERGVKVNY